MCSISTSRATVRSATVCDARGINSAGLADGGAPVGCRLLARFRSSARACEYA